MNRRELLEKNVRFFLSEARPERSFEIFVSDSASNDDTAEYLRGLKNPRVRFKIHPKKILQLENFNEAAKGARGKYIALFHDDNIYEPTLLGKALDILEREPDVGIVCSGFYRATEDGKYSERRVFDIPERLGKNDFIKVLLVKGWSNRFELGITTLVFRKSLFKEIGGFPRKYPAAFDVYFFLLTVLSGKKIAYIKEPLATDIIRKTNISFGRDAMYLEETHRIYLEALKHAKRLQIPSREEIISRSRQLADRLYEKNVALGNREIAEKIREFSTKEFGGTFFQTALSSRLLAPVARPLCIVSNSAKLIASTIIRKVSK